MGNLSLTERLIEECKATAIPQINRMIRSFNAVHRTGVGEAEALRLIREACGIGPTPSEIQTVHDCESLLESIEARPQGPEHTKRINKIKAKIRDLRHEYGMPI